MSKDEGTRTLILTLRNGNIRKLTIPNNWKMTFGSVVPHSPGGHSNREAGGVALRLYEGNKENLRAVYTDVVSFQDSSIETLEKRTFTQRKAGVKSTRHGKKDVIVEARVTEWVDPNADNEDDEPNEFLPLTRIDDMDGGPHTEIEDDE